jgi:hypothetical protein
MRRQQIIGIFPDLQRVLKHRHLYVFKITDIYIS